MTSHLSVAMDRMKSRKMSDTCMSRQTARCLQWALMPDMLTRYLASCSTLRSRCYQSTGRRALCRWRSNLSLAASCIASDSNQRDEQTTFLCATTHPPSAKSQTASMLQTVCKSTPHPPSRKWHGWQPFFAPPPPAAKALSCTRASCR